jgi:hypothetical protein
MAGIGWVIATPVCRDHVANEDMSSEVQEVALRTIMVV